MAVEVTLEGLDLWYMQGVGICEGKVVIMLPNGVAVPLEPSDMQSILAAATQVANKRGCSTCGPTGWKPIPYGNQ